MAVHTHISHEGPHNQEHKLPKLYALLCEVIYVSYLFVSYFCSELRAQLQLSDSKQDTGKPMADIFQRQ